MFHQIRYNMAYVKASSTIIFFPNGDFTCFSVNCDNSISPFLIVLREIRATSNIICQLYQVYSYH